MKPERSQPTLRTRRLTLRPFVANDADRVQHLAGAREIADMTANIPHPYPAGLAGSWIAGLADGFAARRFAAFAIVRTEDDVLIGSVSLGIEEKHRRATLGYWLGVPYWNCGYASEAAASVVGYGFDELALHRIEAGHFSKNPASGRVMVKVGMQYEGRARQYYWKNGEARDTDEYAILASDPRPPPA